MNTETNEMGSYAEMPSAGMDVSVGAPSLEKPDDGMENNGGISIENPTVANTDLSPESVYVYAGSITPVSSEPGSAIASFDVVFSVSCMDPSGTTSTHQVVKRIGVDKMKMANDAKMTTPISIVESEKPAQKAEQPSIISASRDRLKALAGLK